MSDTGDGTGQGKKALFEQGATARRQRSEEVGRRAFFSAPKRSRGSVIVECESCEARTPVPLLELPVRLVPSLWIPVRPFSRWMWCPACRKPAWCKIDWRAALGG